MADQEPSYSQAAENASVPASDPGPKAESAPGLEQQLRQTEQKAQELLESWLRAKAETENLRKRAQVDIANAHKYGVENLAAALLPVRDSLEAALATENITL